MDLETTPTNDIVKHKGIVYTYERELLAKFSEILEGVALLLVHILSPSLERLSLWTPSSGKGPMSMCFSIFHDDSGKDGGPCIQLEAFTDHEREDVWGI